MDRWEACPFDYYGFPRDGIGDQLRAMAAGHAERLTETPIACLRAHPGPGWSALEYGCHVRAVLMVQRERITRAQVGQEPTFGSMGRDERADNGQDPSSVAVALTVAADGLATLLEALDDAA